MTYSPFGAALFDLPYSPYVMRAVVESSLGTGTTGGYGIHIANHSYGFQGTNLMELDSVSYALAVAFHFANRCQVTQVA